MSAINVYGSGLPNKYKILFIDAQCMVIILLNWLELILLTFSTSLTYNDLSCFTVMFQGTPFHQMIWVDWTHRVLQHSGGPASDTELC